MACFKCIYIITFIFFVSSISLFVTAFESDDLTTHCHGRWVHIRRLPSRFNLDLLSNCSEYDLFDNFCPFLANHGLGQKTHNRSRSWYRSDPLMLELTFHRRMLEYPCLTSDPVSANAIYLPYYATLDAFRYLYGPEYNNSNEHGLELFSFLQYDNPMIWNRHNGHDHFLVFSRPAWDFSQPVEADPRLWGTSFLELPEFYNLTALMVEAKAWPWQDQAVPYLTSFHPPSSALLDSWIRRVRNSRRSTLMLFAGGGGVASTPNIRRSIRDECENTSAFGDANLVVTKLCEFVDCSNGKCEHDPLRYMKPMLQSNFCLQPPGDTPTRRSTFDAIVAGCIPVFFELASAKTQYKWHMREEMYDEFSVFIQKEDVVFNDLRIIDVLSRFEESEVRKMREKVIELMPRILYRRHGSSLALREKMDAFDIAVEGTLQKISNRISEGLDQ